MQARAKAKPLSNMAMLNLLGRMGMRPCHRPRLPIDVPGLDGGIAEYPGDLAEMASRTPSRTRRSRPYRRGDMLERRRKLMRTGRGTARARSAGPGSTFAAPRQRARAPGQRRFQRAGAAPRGQLSSTARSWASTWRFVSGGIARADRDQPHAARRVDHAHVGRGHARRRAASQGGQQEQGGRASFRPPQHALARGLGVRKHRRSSESLHRVARASGGRGRVDAGLRSRGVAGQHVGAHLVALGPGLGGLGAAAQPHQRAVRPASYSSNTRAVAGLQRVGCEDAFAELGHLLAVLQDDGVLAHEVDARDVAVEVDANARPVERAATCSMCVDLPVPW